MPFNAKGLLNDSKLALEKAAVDKFGSVVDDFAKNTLGQFIPGASSATPDNRSDPNTWYATSYAASLSGATNYRPKLKFLFKVQFIFTEEAKAAFPEVFAANTSNDFTFMIKSVDRPKIDFEYEEDVNMYNFRTKVLKKIRHRDLTMVFMDDAGNRVFNFFRTLMMLHSPITRRQLLRDRSTTKPDNKTAGPEFGSGMKFSGIQLDGQSASDNAHRGVINSQFGNSIAAIRVKQIFVDPSSSLANATKMVSFDFVNPRIVSFDLDELTHESSEVNLLTMVFDYDWMEMVDIGTLGTSLTPYNDEDKYNIQVKGVNGAPSDISPNRQNGASGSDGGGGNSLFNSLGKIVGRGAQQLSSDLIGKAVRSVAGNGRFASSIVGAATNALAGPIGGIVSGAVRDGLSTGFSTVLNPQGRATASSVVDRSTAGDDAPISIVRTSKAYVTSDPANDI